MRETRETCKYAELRMRLGRRDRAAERTIHQMKLPPVNGGSSTISYG
jgi:hypothetical protein